MAPLQGHTAVALAGFCADGIAPALLAVAAADIENITTLNICLGWAEGLLLLSAFLCCTANLACQESSHQYHCQYT